MVLGKNAKAVIQICLSFFRHQPHSLFFILIPRLSGYFLPVAYKKSHNRLRVLEIMQLEVVSVMLLSIRIVKDVMVQSLHQWNTFDRSEEMRSFSMPLSGMRMS